MKYNTCPKCGTKISDLSECPECGYVFVANAPAERAEYGHVIDANNSSAPAESPKDGHVFGKEKHTIPVILGSALLIAAFAGGMMVTLSHDAEPTTTPTPTTEVSAAPTPVPTPTVEGIEIYAFGRELDADGFTAYVGDKGFTLSAYPVPSVTNPRIEWLSSDSFSLDVSDDTLTCVFTALKPSGKNELSVRCYGAEVVIPVYLWER